MLRRRLNYAALNEFYFLTSVKDVPVVVAILTVDVVNIK